MGKDRQPEDSAVVPQELGTLEVADQVFRDLVRRVVMDVPGVATVRRAGSGLFRRAAARDAVRVERGHGEVAFSISLSVHYDMRIPAMVNELRQRVRSLVEEATGYRVRAVNVAIEHILPPGPGEAEPAGPVGEKIPGPPPIPRPGAGPSPS